MPVFSFAETIELKDGKVVEGKIVEETADWIKIDLGIGVPITYYKEELRNYNKNDAVQKEVSLPLVATIDELTAEQKKNLEENYVTTGVANIDLASKDTEIKVRPPNAEELTDAATKLYNSGCIQEALIKTQEAIDQNKDYLPAYRVMADMLQESGSADKSIPLYDKILEKDPNADEVFMNRGYAYGRLNQFDRAILDYNKALELNPKLFGAIGNRAAAYVKTGNMDLAKKDYENLTAFNKEQAYFGLGNIAAYYGNWEEALSYYDKTIQISPDFAPAYLMKGQILLQVDRKPEGIDLLKKAKSMGMQIPPNFEKLLN